MGKDLESMSEHNKTILLHDFWRELVGSKTPDASARHRIAGWTNVRGTDIVTLSRGDEKSEPVEMTDCHGVNLLPEYVRASYDKGEPVFLRFCQTKPAFVILAIRNVVSFG